MDSGSNASIVRISNFICLVKDGSMALTKKSLKNGAKADGHCSVRDLIHVKMTYCISRLSLCMRISAFPIEDLVFVVVCMNEERTRKINERSVRNSRAKQKVQVLSGR